MTEQNAINLEALRHSAAHIMADAVLRLFPGVKLAIGPAIDDGFYYDFDYERDFSVDDFKSIESEMKKIVKEKSPFVCEEISRKDALKLFKDEPFKLELIEELPENEKITIYRHGKFVDLCKGPHIENTRDVRVFKLLKTAGAYWRGNEDNKQLSRIYGTAFLDKGELKKYLDMLAEAKKRDHRKLGKELELFSTLEKFGPGLVLWHPKGARIRTVIEDFWRKEHIRAGYDLVYTPHIANLELWKQSGHWDFYRENMFSPIDVDNAEYELKPMNCPFHVQIYKTRKRSYREFPVRWAELGTVYRYERSGVLYGLMRVRGFTQDDAHIFCRRDQLEDEIQNVLGFCLSMLKEFGFADFDIYLSTKPEKHVGSDEDWAEATSALEKALKKNDIPFEEDPGEGVFYGPKIDIKIKDTLGRAWQCSTIQVDFNLPERYDMDYTGEDGKSHRPIMVHRALLGSIERFFGVMIEHYAGAFPTWLAPVQAVVIPIGEEQLDYSSELYKQLLKEGLRVEFDERNEKLGFKIRDAQMKKIPYMLVIGKREAEENKVAVRSRVDGDLGAITLEDFVEKIKSELK